MTTGGFEMELNTEILIIGGCGSSRDGCRGNSCGSECGGGRKRPFPERHFWCGQQDTAQEACFCGQRSDFQGLYYFCLKIKKLNKELCLSKKRTEMHIELRLQNRLFLFHKRLTSKTES